MVSLASVFLLLCCFKTLTRRSWHPSEWPIFDTKTFVSNFAASTVITNLLPGQKKIAKLFAKSLLLLADHLLWWRRFFSNQLNIILIVYKPKDDHLNWKWCQFFIGLILFFTIRGGTCKFNLPWTDIRVIHSFYLWKSLQKLSISHIIIFPSIHKSFLKFLHEIHFILEQD